MKRVPGNWGGACWYQDFALRLRSSRVHLQTPFPDAPGVGAERALEKVGALALVALGLGTFLLPSPSNQARPSGPSHILQAG